MASGTIVAESLRTAGREGKLVREHAFNPRSSNGRTAAFGAVNRGSNPCRGANSKSLFQMCDLRTTPNSTLELARLPRRIRSQMLLDRASACSNVIGFVQRRIFRKFSLAVWSRHHRKESVAAINESLNLAFEHLVEN